MGLSIQCPVRGRASPVERCCSHCKRRSQLPSKPAGRFVNISKKNLVALGIACVGIAVLGGVAGSFFSRWWQGGTYEHGYSHVHHDSSLLHVGDVAPDIELTDLAGLPTSPLEIIKDKATIFLFLAAGCGACEKAIKDAKTFKDELPPDIQIVGICSQDYEQARSFKEESRLPFQLYCDPAAVFREEYGMSTYPSTVGFTRDGHVALVKEGYSPKFTILDACMELTKNVTSN